MHSPALSSNMRGSKGDQSEFHRHPNLSAIFGNAFSPASGNGLRITYGLETHCRHSFKAPRLLAVAGCQPLPRTDAARAKMNGVAPHVQGLSAKAGHLGRKSDRASTYSNRGVQPSTPPTRLTVTRGDKAQSPFSSWSSSYALKSNLLMGLTGSHAKIAGHSPFHQLASRVSRRQGDGILFSSSHRSRPAILNDNLQGLEAEASALAARIAAKKARLK